MLILHTINNQEIALGGQTFKMGQPGCCGGSSVATSTFNQQVFYWFKSGKIYQKFYQLNANLTEEQIIERFLMHIFRFYSSRTENTLESSYSSTEKVRNVIKSFV